MGRTLEVTPEVVRFQTQWTAQLQTVPRKNIVSFQIGRSMLDIWGMEKTITFWTTDGQKHVIKHLKTKDAEEIIKQLEQSANVTA